TGLDLVNQPNAQQAGARNLDARRGNDAIDAADTAADIYRGGRLEAEGASASAQKDAGGGCDAEDAVARDRVDLARARNQERPRLHVDAGTADDAEIIDSGRGHDSEGTGR